MSRRKDEAYKSLNCQYIGERKNFTFEVYTNVHQKAHQDLLRMGEPVPENRKVQIFMDNIRDHNLAAGKAAILASVTMSVNFVMAANYLANFVARTKSSFENDRRISALDAGRGRSGRGGRGRGRGRGLGHRGGLGHGGDSMDKHYSSIECAKLSHEQKSKVLQLRDEKKKRKISALSTDDEKGSTEKKNIDNHAGDQFGRQVHKH
ncbi:MAG: hypothetical protein ACREBR_03675 [bacterium]